MRAVVAVKENTRRLVLKAGHVDRLKAVIDIVVARGLITCEQLYSGIGKAHSLYVVEVAAREGLKFKAGLCSVVAEEIDARDLAVGYASVEREHDLHLSISLYCGRGGGVVRKSAARADEFNAVFRGDLLSRVAVTYVES